MTHARYLSFAAAGGSSVNTERLDVTVARTFQAATGVPVEDATPEHVEAWWLGLSERGLSRQTRASYLRGLRRFYTWRQRRTGQADPTAHLRAPSVPPGRPRPVPERDVALALAMTPGDARVQLALAAYCGLRVSEIAGLQPGDVHTDTLGRRYVRVRGKGGRQRDVPVPDVLDDLLAAYTWPATSSTAVSTGLRRAMHRLGLPYSGHQLRHFYATSVLAADRDVVAVQRLLGHASLMTTQVYADVSADRLHEAVAAAFDVSARAGAGKVGA